MTPILIEPLSEQAYELLLQLEALHILRVIFPENQAHEGVPRKWAGALGANNAQAATAWDKHLQDIRGEWERDS